MRSLHIPIALAAFALLPACAAGGDETDGSGGNGQGGLDWSTSSTGGGASSTGGGGNGGDGGMGGASNGPGGGGNGGAGGGGNGGAGGGGNGGGGGAATEQLLVFAAGSSGALAGSYAPGPGWATANLAGSFSGASVQASAAGAGLALTRNTTGDVIQYSEWNGSSFAAPANIAANVSGQGFSHSYNPGDSRHHVAYHGLDFMHYHSAYNGTVWLPATEPVQPMVGAQSFGPSTAAIAYAGADTILAFAGNDSTLYTQLNAGGAWQAAQPISNSHIQLSPTLIAPTANAELFAVWVNHEPNQFDDKKLFWSARNGGNWSTPAKISDQVFTDDPIRSTALASGGVLVAYRGTDGKAYTVRYTPGASPPWGVALPISANNNPDVVSAPAICRGADGADAELLYVETGSGSLHHSRLMGGWTMPASLGGSGLSHVDVARVP